MKRTAIVLGLIASIASFSAFAGEQKLVTVTTDAVEGALDILVITDAEGNAEKIRYVTPKSTQDFNLAQLRSGIVLFRHSGKDVVRLASKDFNNKAGGNIEINYLTNGIWNSRSKYWIVMTSTGGDWNLIRDDRQGRRTFSQMYMKSNRVAGKIVGIGSITVR